MTYLFLALLLALPLVTFGKVTQERVHVRLVTDEAEAVLAILAKKKANEAISEADWQKLFATEGYVRLKQRETSMQRSFEDTDFKTFVLSDQLAGRAPALREALDKWRRTDLTRAAQFALNYLPKDARIRAKIYPVIKPRENSFVFDVTNDPAIFSYIDQRSVRRNSKTRWLTNFITSVMAPVVLRNRVQTRSGNCRQTCEQRLPGPGLLVKALPCSQRQAARTFTRTL